jgi:hypothetical protein
MAETPKRKRPRLTVRSAAEMLDKSPDLMAKMLYNQKYPEQSKRAIRAPYYQHVVAGMRKFFSFGRGALINTRSEIQGFRQPSRRDNNNRVLASFEGSPLAQRKLNPIPNRRYYAQIGDVELRLSPDLQATEDGEIRVIYFNCKKEKYDPEIARRLVEIAYWVMFQNGVRIRPDQVEFVDLFDGSVYSVSEVRAKTLESLDAEALQVTRLWEEL